MQKTVVTSPDGPKEQLEGRTRTRYEAPAQGDVAGGEGTIRVGGMEFLYWLDAIGRGRTVGWKWRKEGRVKTVNIDGKLYIRQEEIDRFWDRAEAGEFAKPMSGACGKETAC